MLFQRGLTHLSVLRAFRRAMWTSVPRKVASEKHSRPTHSSGALAMRVSISQSMPMPTPASSAPHKRGQMAYNGRLCLLRTGGIHRTPLSVKEPRLADTFLAGYQARLAAKLIIR